MKKLLQIFWCTSAMFRRFRAGLQQAISFGDYIFVRHSRYPGPIPKIGEFLSQYTEMDFIAFIFARL